jgi:hypothetical protein
MPRPVVVNFCDILKRPINRLANVLLRNSHPLARLFLRQILLVNQAESLGLPSGQPR